MMDLGAIVDAVEAALREAWPDHDVRVYPSGTRTMQDVPRYVQEWTARVTTREEGDTMFTASAVGDDSATALGNIARTLRVR